MLDWLQQHWVLGMFVVITIGYICLLKYVAKRDREQQAWSDEEILTLLARKRGISEHQYFQDCARRWHFTPAKANEDFNRYLKEGVLPYYVRDTIRKEKDQTHPPSDPPVSSGGSLPPSWSA